MFNFNLHLPTKILFGKGQIAHLASQLPANARVLFAYGGGSIKRNSVYQQVVEQLESAGFFWKEFSGIEPNPCYETLMQAVALVKQEQLDFILAVGGGSVLDGCKFIAATTLYQGEPWQILTEKTQQISAALPLGAVLTIPATGSEMNGYAVISRKSTQQKLSFASPLVKPQFSILDPSVTFSLPARQTANGVVDAFVHTFEQYMTYPVNAKIQDRFAEGVFQTLIEEGPKLLDNPQDYDARANIMWAATMALNDVLSVGVPEDWASHAIGHEITAQYGLDHAQTLAIVVPALMNEQRAQKKQKIIQYAQRVWHFQGDDEKAVDFAIQQTRQFFESMGVKTHFSDYGIDDSQFPQLLKKLHQHHPYNLGEHQDIDLAKVERILRAAL